MILGVMQETTNYKAFTSSREGERWDVKLERVHYKCFINRGLLY